MINQAKAGRLWIMGVPLTQSVESMFGSKRIFRWCFAIGRVIESKYFSGITAATAYGTNVWSKASFACLPLIGIVWKIDITRLPLILEGIDLSQTRRRKRHSRFSYLRDVLGRVSIHLARYIAELTPPSWNAVHQSAPSTSTLSMKG